MTDRISKEKSQGPSPKEARAERLAEVLRANLKRRKEAARSRTGGKDNTPGE
ncbi:hypothetical protein [Hyphomicrobium denitrificans]|uniref:hypothetical protein n=1 Tax=Hyphomicrobium denitrificans TaxID=53399 RepID=UPI00022E744A|nr:hypothetical protein [Hyphomicrobium denitrificans]